MTDSDFTTGWIRLSTFPQVIMKYFLSVIISLEKSTMGVYSWHTETITLVIKEVEIDSYILTCKVVARFPS